MLILGLFTCGYLWPTELQKFLFFGPNRKCKERSNRSERTADSGNWQHERGDEDADVRAEGTDRSLADNNWILSNNDRWAAG